MEKIVEGIVDLCYLVVKYEKLKTPEEDAEVFRVLKDAGILSEDLASRLKDAKGMRNIIVHEYGAIDDHVVFTAIEEEIIDDTNSFLEIIQKRFNLAFSTQSVT